MSDIVTRLAELSGGDRQVLLKKLSQRKRRRVAPLSHAQQRLWFLEQMTPGNPRYNETSAFRLSYAVDTPSLKRSLNEIIKRHEALRTVFESDGNEPRQCVLPSLEVDLPVQDFSAKPPARRESEAVELVLSEGLRPFNLTTGPLLRAILIRFNTHDYLFAITMHHIVCDGWSMRIFFDELAQFYGAYISGRELVLEPLPVQYADYSIWQRQWLNDVELNKRLAYWRDQLAGASPLDLPSDFVRPPVPTFAGGRERLTISPSVFGALREICRREDATLFMVFLAIFQVLLHRYTSQTDISVGCPIANRGKPELERLIGFFVNTLVMRTDLSGNPSFVEALRRVRETTLSAYANQDLPFERLVEELHPVRDLSRNPLFQVTFQLLNPPADAAEAPAPGLSVVDLNLATSKFDLRCDLTETGGHVAGYLEYSLDLFRAETIRSMARHFETLVEAVARQPYLRIAELPMLSPQEEKRLLVDWNRTQRNFPRDAGVHELFQRQAALQPGGLAVCDSSMSVTYGELNAVSNQLARYLRKHGVVPGSLVGVMMNRSVNYVLAIVSILKCGGAFVPIDPSYPEERVASMISDSTVQLVVTTEAHSAAVPRHMARILVDNDRSSWSGEDVAGIPCHISLQSLAYVIFTSGSTGRPKGVEVPHSALLNLVQWHNSEYNITPADRASLFASPAFDASVWEMWPYLIAGASLWVPDEVTRVSTGDLREWISRSGLTICFLPTPVAENILHDGGTFANLRVLLTGGDRLREYPKRRLPFRFINHYGPTENAVVATFADVTTGPENETPPIGRPISNVRAYVLDRQLRPVPAGVRGELYLAGESLARGYLNDDALTRQRFVPNPFESASGSVMYRTGDLVRYRLDGSLEFHGRADRQVKIRGFRIEPGDIEAALNQHPAVAQTLVVPYESSHHGASVAAYIVASRNDVVPGEDKIRITEDERTSEWRRIYDAVYSGNRDGASDFDIVGWNSSYSGEAIGKEQMLEQIEGTVARIQALGAKRILEIGCGTGLLLLRLAGDCTRYVGTDFSEVVLSQLKHQCEVLGWNHVELLERHADDFSGIEGQFDAVVLNSVVQYFPDLHYLARVLSESATRLSERGALYIGDVRRLRLLPWFYGGIAIQHVGDDAGVEEISEAIEQRRRQEQELVLDENWFAGFAATANLESPRIEIRRGLHHNELTKFRYDVVLPRSSSEFIEGWNEVDWRDIGSIARLRDLLREGNDNLLVRGIPNARLAGESHLMKALGQPELISSARDLRREVRQAEGYGVEPEALWRLEEETETGCIVRVGWSPQDPGELWARVAVKNSRRTRWSWNCRAEKIDRSAPTGYSNDVLTQRAPHEIAEDLREHLRQKLPDYMIPTQFVWMDRLPVTANGKLNRKALPQPEHPGARIAGYVAPRPGLEEQIAAIWQRVLGLERISANANFFDLGGHSLLLVRVHSGLKESLQESDVSVIDLFAYPTIRALARFIAAERNKSFHTAGRSR